MPKPIASSVDPAVLAAAQLAHPRVVAATTADLASIAKTVPTPAGYSVARVDVWGYGIRWGLAQYTGASPALYAFLELTGSGWRAMQKGNEVSMCRVAVPGDAVQAIASLLPLCAKF
jgi:hypothetical protein